MSRLISRMSCCIAVLAASPAFADDNSGGRPGDAAMTCQQIAAELAPYAQPLMPAGNAANEAATQLMERNQARMANEIAPAASAFLGAQTAAHLDPTGLSGRAVQQASSAYQQELWQRTLREDAPLSEKLNTATGDLVQQGQAMQGNPRLQRLLQLVQEKGCDQQ